MRKRVAPPFLKWPGGKRVLLPELLSLIPANFGQYYEPFLGGGALFFALAPTKGQLSDLNTDLMECYTVVRDAPESVIKRLRTFTNSETKYYQVRASRRRSPAGRAARLIYLTTLSFNGIFRVNKQGEFNVPYGHRKHLDVVQPDRIYRASGLLAGTTLKCADFATGVKTAKAGDLVYLDPPYTVAHGSNGFLKYNANLFSWEDQARLAEATDRLAQRGCHIVMTNADHDSIRELYRDFKQYQVSRASCVSASSQTRKSVTELILRT